MRTILKKEEALPKGIRKRGSRYCVDVTVAGRRKTSTAANLTEALVRREELTAALQSGAQAPTPTATQQWTLEKGVQTTINTRWRGSKAEHSATQNATRALEFFGKDTLLDDIDAEWLDRYVEWLVNRGNSNGGINRKLAALSTIFSTAVDRGGAQRRPKMPRQREGQGRIRWLTNEEEYRMLHLLSQWGEFDMMDVVTVLMDTGLRLGELWNLEGRDIHRSRISIWENKASHPRTVPMTARVKEIIDRRGQSHGQKPFPYNNSWMRTKWQRIRSIMGMDNDPQFVPHMLRHTCASRLVQRGATIPVVQQWLGHKTIQMTMRYAHLAPTHLEDAAKLLE